MADANSAKVEFVDYKTKKLWVEKMSGYKCVMLCPRRLHIAHGPIDLYWTWNCYKETSEIDNVEVAKLRRVFWLNLRGHIKMSELSSGVVYEIAYIVKLTNGASGWELPITLKLRHPDGKEQTRQQSLLHKPRGEWMELSDGTFKVNQEETGEFWFDLYEHGDTGNLGSSSKLAAVDNEVMYVDRLAEMIEEKMERNKSKKTATVQIWRSTSD